MSQYFPMKRFPDLVDGKGGVFDFEAKQYGVGAFSWLVHDDGVRHIVFRHPDKVWRNSAGEPIGVGSIPVDEGRWTWDGNLDQPTISPSIMFKTSHPEQEGWQETFHGFVRGGVLEVL